jgi:outer membrane protein OmpA-like peptidoglycan-associated protein
MRFLVLIVFFFVGYITKAQTYNPENIKGKAVKLYAKAVTQIADGNLKEAIETLNKTIAADDNYLDAYLSLAGVYGEMKNYNNAVATYEKAFAKDSSYTNIYKLPYSINLAGAGKFTEALQQINAFLTIPNITSKSINAANYRKRNYEFAIDYQKKHPNNNYSFEPVNLGDSVNTERSEYYPTVSISDSLLVFTRMSNTGENFVKSNFTNNHFTMAEIVEGSINNQALKGAATVSNDGEWLIFAGDFFEKGYGSYDLYISYSTPDGWSEPENLGDKINTPYWESAPSISPDSRTLYFSSDRPGGYGGRDLYMSTRLPNGKWSYAVNLGPTINTVGNELYPYIHADNQTLYFTSDGLPGYGKTDLFITRKTSLDEWSNPENLGFPINTIEDEGSICISSNGLTAYYAADKADSRGGLDLYKFDLREDIRPFKTLFVKGTVYDAVSNKGIPCSVELVDNATKKTIMKITADEIGKYFIPLPTGKDYTFIVNRKGYLYYSNLYELSKEKSDSTYIKDIALQPVQLNATMVFKNVQFEKNAYNLLPVSTVELDKLVQLLTENPAIKLQINGHTDNTGNADDNLKLSTNRAKSVVDYLVSKNISATRLTYKGFGATKSIADNNTEEGKAQNRRTEFVVVGM